MKDILEQIYRKAKEELPLHYHEFKGESAIMYKGFKVSRSSEGYKWEDMRYSNYYEEVDPRITEEIIRTTFSKTISDVMNHDDKEKITFLKRDIVDTNNLIQLWTKESTYLWNNYKKKIKGIESDKKLTYEIKDKRKVGATAKYNTKKALFQKKRKVLSEKKDCLNADLKFFEARVKSNN